MSNLKALWVKIAHPLQGKKSYALVVISSAAGSLTSTAGVEVYDPAPQQVDQIAELSEYLTAALDLADSVSQLQDAQARTPSSRLPVAVWMQQSFTSLHLGY